MTAPEPPVYWSPTKGVLQVSASGFGYSQLAGHTSVRELPSDAVRIVPTTGPIPPRVQVAWVDHDEDDGDLHETGWIMAVEGETAVINCDCGPRTVRRPLSALTLGRLVPAAAPTPTDDASRDLFEVAGKAAWVVRLWRDWPQDRRDKVRALSGHLADALEDLRAVLARRPS